MLIDFQQKLLILKTVLLLCYACMYGLYGTYNWYGLLCLVSGFITISVSSYTSYFGLLNLRAEERSVLPQVKPLRCGEASRKPRALI